jgi:hypothetical protein
MVRNQSVTVHREPGAVLCTEWAWDCANVLVLFEPEVESLALHSEYIQIGSLQVLAD